MLDSVLVMDMAGWEEDWAVGPCGMDRDGSEILVVSMRAGACVQEIKPPGRPGWNNGEFPPVSGNEGNSMEQALPASWPRTMGSC